MDLRYTGHLYHFLQRATEFAKRQPRKHLWERNTYFYIPTIHGTWDDFIQKVDREMVNRDSIWGPRPAKGINVEGQTKEPPVSNPDDDSWEWGVGEEADLITWLPHFDPERTNWAYRNYVYNFPERAYTPRRASVVAMSRLSTRLLRLLHKDQVERGVGLGSEMSPLSWAMYYGLKAVQIPQPLYHPHKWDLDELNRYANSDEFNARWYSIWSWNQHNELKRSLSYMWASDFPEKLYRTWLGFNTELVSYLFSLMYVPKLTAEMLEGESRRLCLPPMFLHPVKNVGKL